MILTLEVMGEQDARLGAGRRKVFDAIGGTIGRLPDNDWVLADPYVSGRHALIRYLNGRFFVEDTSTNGVFVNSPDFRLSRSQTHPLKHGDVLYIDAYQIAVSIERDAAADDDHANDPLVALKAHAKKQRNPDKAPPENRVPERTAPVLEEENRTPSLGQPATDTDSSGPSGNETQWFGLSEMSLAELAAAARSRPDAAAMQSEPAAPPTAKSESRPIPHLAANATDNQLQALLAAAGVKGIDPPDELARTCGEILRVVVPGLMEVLRGRQRMKEELHMRVATVKSAQNNPLNSAANADDALQDLLARQNPGDFEPAEAFAEALQDVQDHQAAVQSAMRLAFESTVAQFDPNRLQEEFDRQMKKGSILGVPAKLRYWDLYREKYGAMVQHAETSFRTLFGTEFAKAYEEHIERLQARGRSR